MANVDLLGGNIQLTYFKEPITQNYQHFVESIVIEQELKKWFQKS